MKIGREQLAQLLREQGRHAEAERAERELPAAVDTSVEHDLDLLEGLGLDPLETVKHFTITPR
jgi:hypothetical protein